MNNLLSEQISPLSISEKLQLIEDIWNSITVDEEHIPLPQSHQQELERRLAFYRDFESQGSTWEEVKRRIVSNDL
jgi:putative addiction module component (TIGR02574 family)